MMPAKPWLWFAFPLILLGGLSLVVLGGGLPRLSRGVPPVEELTVERVRLTPGHIVVDVVNGGLDPVTIAQVMVEDAFWAHTVTPGRSVPRPG